jgi:hypothetical protein
MGSIVDDRKEFTVLVTGFGVRFKRWPAWVRACDRFAHRVGSHSESSTR